MRCVEIFSLLGLASSLLLGCEKPESHRDDSAAASDAAASKVSDEPDLAKAVENVAAPRPMGPGDGATADGPPPNGIFGPGAADKAMAKGSPAAITLGSDGAAPRVQLGPAPKPGSKRSGSIEVATQSDPRQGAIPISLALTIEALKPKGDADAGLPGSTQMVAKVTGATINAPSVPAEIAAGVAKLKGSHVLVRSKLVEMAMSIVAMLVGGGILKLYSSPPAFLAVVREAAPNFLELPVVFKHALTGS